MTLTRLRNNKGRVNLGCILMAIIIAVGGYHGYVFGMTYIQHYRFQEKLGEVIELANHQTKAYVDNLVIDTASGYGIKLESKNVFYEQKRRDVVIEVNYEVLVETLMLKRVLYFRATAKRHFPI